MNDIDQIKQSPALPILLHFGLSIELLDGKGHPCPKCGGTDRFHAFKDVATSGKIRCRGCLRKGSGDAIGAVAWLLNTQQQGEAIKQIVDYLNIKRRGSAAQYRYYNANGEHVYTVHRTPLDKHPWKTFRQQAANGSWSMEGVERVPYNLTEVINADLVFAVEGEKDVDRLRRHGLVGTCNSGGAGKWQPEFGKYLAGKRVVVIPDNDKAGRDHAAAVMASLADARQKAILTLPGPDKSDVSDWLDAGGTIDELLKLADAALEAPSEPETAEPAAEKEPPPTTRAGELFVKYLAKLQAGELVQLVKQYEALGGFELAQGQVTVVGGPPGGGKTALAMQVMFDGLELNSDLRAVVANAEMSFEVLMRRELTRATRINSDAIRFGKLTSADLERIHEASHDIIQRLQRVSVLNDPCTLFNLLRLKDEAPGLLLVDYLQKFADSDKDTKQGVTNVMSGLRALAKAGWAVLCLSATSRTQGKGGSGHDSQKLNQASFRDSGEIEFNADAAYLLVDNGAHEGTEYIREMQLRCVKNRHGAKKHHDLIFHQPRMSFAKPQPVSQFSGDFDDYSRNPYAEAEAF